MKGMILPFALEQLPELAALAQGLNARRETGSSFCCSHMEDIQREFAKTMAYGFAFWSKSRPLGLISCFPDVEKGNADCSLLLEVSGAAYDGMAEGLLSHAREKLGREMALTFFFPVENADCRRFLTKVGAQPQENEYILLLKGGDWSCPGSLAAQPRPALAEEREAFERLHDMIFPGVYISGKDIWEELGNARFVYTVQDEHGLAAYGVLKIAGGKRAVAEVLGVRPDARRRGYGRSVLCYLAEQAFTLFEKEELELVVDSDNRAALRLYLDLGFQIWQENNCYILISGDRA